MTDPTEPSAEVDLIAAALRADHGDVTTLTRVVAASLGDALPAGVVEVERRRSMADRLAGREGEPVAVLVRLPERQLELRQAGHGVSAQVRQVVRGVVIARRDVDIDEWVRTLAEELAALAARDATARAALARFLGA